MRYTYGLRGRLVEMADTADEEEPLASSAKDLARQQKERAYASLIEVHPTSVGKMVSRKEREARRLRSQDMTYGEIKFTSFGRIFSWIRERLGELQEPGGVFYDLGSGTGKPVFAAALLHDFDRCVGIELLEGLHACALELQTRWDAMKTADPPTLKSGEQRTAIELINGDITTDEWSDATFVFTNSTCFTSQLMRELAELSLELKPGALWVSFTRELPSEEWELLLSEQLAMSWGPATIYIQRRR